MKKILHISNYYLPNKGGIEQVAYDIVSSLKGEYEQQVICFSGDGKYKQDYYDGIKVTRVGYIKKIASQAFSFSYYNKLKIIIRDFNPDIIHFHLPNPLIGIYYLMLKENKKRRLILHWHSDIVKQEKLLKLYKSFQEKILKKANKIIITSPNYKTSKFLKEFQKKLYVVPNVVDIRKFQLIDESKKNIKKLKEKYNNEKIIFFLGRHVEYKGIEFLIKASKLLKNKNTKILIAGSGPLTDKLKEESKADKKIEFLGRISDKELKEYLYAADIFAFPSITKNEAFGVALAEALYCETPAVTFTIKGSGVNWVNKRDVTGLEVENSNITEYAEALDKLLNDDILREEMAQNAQDRVLEKFSNKNLRLYLKEIYP